MVTKQYLLHTCIEEESGILVDITEWKAKAKKERFAPDKSIVFNVDNKTEFEFYSEEFGRLPLTILVKDFC
jgi:hypothetical protein